MPFKQAMIQVPQESNMNDPATHVIHIKKKKKLKGLCKPKELCLENLADATFKFLINSQALFNGADILTQFFPLSPVISFTMARI